jgi:hypothetical protein
LFCEYVSDVADSHLAEEQVMPLEAALHMEKSLSFRVETLAPEVSRTGF